jgi:hypothetical protein
VCPAAAQNFELEFTEQALNRLVAQLGDSGKSGVHQSNDLSALGYGKCGTIGILDCTAGTNAQASQGIARRPTASTQQGAARANVHLAVCQGPDGRSAIVPAPELVTWQWWITEARFSIRAQQLQFTAKVRYRVGRQWVSEEKTVPAVLSLDIASQRLRMGISSFTVPVRYTVNGLAETITEVDVGRHMGFGIPISPQTFQVTDLEGRARTLTSRAQSANIEYLPGQIRVRVYGGFN